MIIKLVLNGLVGGFVVFIGPFIAFLYLLINRLIFRSPMVQEQLETVAYYHKLGIDSPVLMMLIILGILFLCGFIFSTLGLGISVIIHNKYVAILIPFLYFLISSTVLTQFSSKLNFVAFYDVDYGMTFGERGTYALVLLMVSALIYFVGGSKKFEENQI